MRVDQPKIGSDLVSRDNAHLDRQHQGHEDCPKTQPAQQKAGEHYRIGRGQGYRDLANCNGERHDQAVAIGSADAAAGLSKILIFNCHRREPGTPGAAQDITIRRKILVLSGLAINRPAW